MSVQLKPIDHAGWLAINELDFPGWRANVDGVALPTQRGNGAL